MKLLLKFIPRSLFQGTLSKLIRHLFAAASGWLVGQGFEPDGTLSGFLIAGICLGVSLVWSWLSKGRPLDPETGDLVKQAVTVLAAQLVAALSGWLAQHGFHGDANDPVVFGLFVANWLISILDRKDAVALARVLVVAAILALVALPATACSPLMSRSGVDDVTAVRGVMSGIPMTWVCVPIRNGREYHWRACLGSDGSTVTEVFGAPQGR